MSLQNSVDDSGHTIITRNQELTFFILGLNNKSRLGVLKT